MTLQRIKMLKVERSECEFVLKCAESAREVKEQSEEICEVNVNSQNLQYYLWINSNSD